MRAIGSAHREDFDPREILPPDMIQYHIVNVQASIEVVNESSLENRIPADLVH